MAAAMGRARRPLATAALRARVAEGLAWALVVAPPLVAQRDEPALATPDPYTSPRGADPDEVERAVERAGYLRIGPMTWGDRHGTPRIEEALGKVPICWIETRHFKLGCALASLPMPRGKDERAKLRTELELLGERLPTLRPRSVKELDPWLRAHLFALRLESLYAELQGLLGVSDEDFPGEDAPMLRRDAPTGAEWMGRGPYLGMKSKYLVLLCEEPSAVTRYLTTFTGAKGDTPSSWYFGETDAFLFATAEGFAEGAFRQDRALHAHVVFNVAHNLIDGYRGYSYLVPIWWKEGLAHRLRRAVSLEHNNFSGIDDRGRRAYTTFDWEAKLRQRASHGLVTPWSAMAAATDCEDFDLIDHAACWSRVSWLIDERPAGAFARFVKRMKGLVDAQGMPPDADTVLRMQEQACREELGADFETLDAEWLDWVAREYRGR